MEKTVQCYGGGLNVGLRLTKAWNGAWSNLGVFPGIVSGIPVRRTAIKSQEKSRCDENDTRI